MPSSLRKVLWPACLAPGEKFDRDALAAHSQIAAMRSRAAENRRAFRGERTIAFPVPGKAAG